MRYENKAPSFMSYGSMYEDKLKSYNLVEVPNVEVSIVTYILYDSTDDENLCITYNYSYVYNSVADEFMNITIKRHTRNGRYYDPAIWKSLFASPITAITVTYNGTDEVE